MNHSINQFFVFTFALKRFFLIDCLIFCQLLICGHQKLGLSSFVIDPFIVNHIIDFVLQQVKPIIK